MKEVDLPWCEAEEVLKACQELGAIVTLDGTLKSVPGGRHWHFKMPSEKGTLEITHWPARQRAWVKVAQNREGAWMDEFIQTLISRLA